MNYKTKLLFMAIEKLLEDNTPINKKTDLITADMGALIRDQGVETALNAAKLRRDLGAFSDLAYCAKFVKGAHRRRIKK